MMLHQSPGTLSPQYIVIKTALVGACLQVENNSFDHASMCALHQASLCWSVMLRLSTHASIYSPARVSRLHVCEQMYPAPSAALQAAIFMS
jgi:hypothetical protein